MANDLSRNYHWINPEGQLPPLALPKDAEEAREHVTECWRRGDGLLLAGGGNHWFVGNRTGPIASVISLARMNRVVDYSPPDMTLTVQPGCTLGSLESLLSESGQFLPFFPPGRPDSTVGGAVSAGLRSPWSDALGGVRDHLIGVECLHGDGTLSHAGGRVVKNVAGYDLCKLYAGALGTLGILTQLTFKVRPLPPSRLTAVARGNRLSELLAKALRLRESIQPAAAEIFRESRTEASPSGEPLRLALRLLDSPSVARWKLEGVLKELPQAEVLSGKEEEAFWSRRAQDVQGIDWRDASAVLVMGGPIGLLQEMRNRLDELFEVERWSLAPLAGRITTVVSAQGLQGNLEKLRASWRWRHVYSILWKSSAIPKQGIDVWGPSASRSRIQSSLRSELDPKGILNPGRV